RKEPPSERGRCRPHEQLVQMITLFVSQGAQIVNDAASLLASDGTAGALCADLKGAGCLFSRDLDFVPQPLRQPLEVCARSCPLQQQLGQVTQLALLSPLHCRDVWALDYEALGDLLEYLNLVPLVTTKCYERTTGPVRLVPHVDGIDVVPDHDGTLVAGQC